MLLKEIRSVIFSIQATAVPHLQPTTNNNTGSMMLTALCVAIAILVTILIFVCALYFRRTYQEVRLSREKKNHTCISLDRKCLYVLISVNDVRILRRIVATSPSKHDLL